MKIAVIGLGLIGGSLAKSIKLKTQHSVFGFDADNETMMLARLCGAVDGALTDAILSECDVILVALRPDIAIGWITENSDKIKKNAIVTDMCGVKCEVTAALSPLAAEKGFKYIGGHPMAGKEVSGFVNSDSSLFDGAYMILTPDAHTEIKILEAMKNLFTDIGFSGITYSTPGEHDKMIALTSQLAHVISSAYIKSPEAEKHRGFSAGSFMDMTRVARLDENMWTQLFLMNADNLSEQIGILIDNLSDFKNAIDEKDAEEVRRLLKEGKEKKAIAGGF